MCGVALTHHCAHAELGHARHAKADVNVFRLELARINDEVTLL